MKPARLLQPVFACLTACVALAQQGAEPAVPATLPDEEDGPAVEEEWDFSKGRALDPAMMEMLDRMVPVGSKPHEGLRYPVFGKRKAGRAPAREALFESRRVTRMDETHLLFEGAVYSSYDDPKRPDAATRTVTLKNAIYDIQNHLLFSDTPMKVEDRQFGIRCNSLLRDLTTGFSLYSGDVELYWDDTSDEVAAPAPPPAPSK